MAPSSAGFVTALTTAALATVGLLGYQASTTAPVKNRTDSAPAAVTSKVPQHRKDPAALPAASGTGARVVYSLDSDRVWLVGPGDAVTRTFKVTPGNVDPAPGVYAVSSRSNLITGTDGIPVEHVVRFASDVDGVAIGFSAAVRDAAPGPDATPLADTGTGTVRTGGIRESRADGDAMWTFAMIGAQVVVVH
ncbi:hypothetical protein ACFYZI_01535 [Streptomyces griseorubiginosus]|uniref:Secreted protein n=1 Tax=Streptomyces griseorubiginosus TaxID=67304 RepID=A0A117R519_9ACTN|nr:hypothetical protein [Streptomyces griseorubiginosus]AYC39158.1 hypothetical protein DWG14_03391 [Streptomyces griseorubiginosus]KUM77433.1 hypothetical protein AQI84_10275 [Streptomyces griseorubiginosus]KUN71476.1 hypothetical protein AQJ54_01565 [Streptomyces griseorubiginosus]